jgi:hypothetical protein
MGEYIEREALMALLEERRAYLFKENGDYDHYSNGFDEAVDKVENFPAADVAPVVYSKWIDGADSFGAKRGQYRVCSRCNICIPCVIEVSKSHWQYCPNCGAHMEDGE